MSEISIIIPTLNEVETLRKNLNSITATSQIEIEIIVVDSSSHDKTQNIANIFDVKIIPSRQRNRAYQMNLGAAAASGKILIFLHADTLLPSDYWQLVGEILASPQTVAGAFELGIDGGQKFFRLIEMAVNWRSRFLSLPYGDQAIFIKAEIFRQVGGFAQLPIMEDYELVKRLQKLGKIRIAPAKVLTSSRRWQKLGICRTTAINQGIILGYHLGIPATELARWYGKSNH
jgi:rSAM/selenodomain-associated transferase 2